jgi:hypothetical protein
MNRNIALVVKKVDLHKSGNDFAYWQSQPFSARIDALEEIRREYHAWFDSFSKDSADVQPGFQRVYRILKHQ